MSNRKVQFLINFIMCVSQIEVVTLTIYPRKNILVVEEAIRFLKQPKEYEFKDKLILQLLENLQLKAPLRNYKRAIMLIGMIQQKIGLIGKLMGIY